MLLGCHLCVLLCPCVLLCEHHKQLGWCSNRLNMECGTGTGTAHSRPSSSLWMQTGRRAARKAPARFLPFVNAASSVNKQNSTLASNVSRRQTLQQLMLAAAALSLDVTSHLVHPHRAEAALVQFPAADLRNSYYLVSLTRKAVAVHCCKGDNLQVHWLTSRLTLLHQRTDTLPECSNSGSVCSCMQQHWSCLQVRAGEGQCEADDYVLTNTVFKTSMSNGLSKTGKRQVARQVATLTAVVQVACLYGVQHPQSRPVDCTVDRSSAAGARCLSRWRLLALAVHHPTQLSDSRDFGLAFGNRLQPHCARVQLPGSQVQTAGVVPATLQCVNLCCCPSQCMTNTLGFSLGMLWPMSHCFDISLHLINVIKHLFNFPTTVNGCNASHTAHCMAWRGLRQNDIMLSILCCVRLKHDHLYFGPTYL